MCSLSLTPSWSHSRRALSFPRQRWRISVRFRNQLRNFRSTCRHQTDAETLLRRVRWTERHFCREVSTTSRYRSRRNDKVMLHNRARAKTCWLKLCRILLAWKSKTALLRTSFCCRISLSIRIRATRSGIRKSIRTTSMLKVIDKIQPRALARWQAWYMQQWVTGWNHSEAVKLSSTRTPRRSALQDARWLLLLTPHRSYRIRRRLRGKPLLSSRSNRSLWCHHLCPAAQRALTWHPSGTLSFCSMLNRL